jgi:hypothetical protein
MIASTLYKPLNLDGTDCNGHEGRWALPRDSEPGDWMSAAQYRLYSLERLTSALGPAMYVAEYRGGAQRIKQPYRDDFEEGIVLVAEARLVARVKTWTPQAAASLAADCAEHVLDIFETVYPKDHRLRSAIEAARQYPQWSAETFRVNMPRVQNVMKDLSAVVLATNNDASMAGMGARRRGASVADSNIAAAPFTSARAVAQAVSNAVNAAGWAFAYNQGVTRGDPEANAHATKTIHEVMLGVATVAGAAAAPDARAAEQTWQLERLRGYLGENAATRQ